jgi:hypothetical protein
MSTVGSVLVLTHPFDPTADKVVGELNRRGVSVFRCDAADFPRSSVPAPSFSVPARRASCEPSDVAWS